MDTSGLVLKVVVHSAAIQDRDGAKQVLTGCHEQFPRLEKVWVDQGYRGQLVNWAKSECGLTIEVVQKTPEQQDKKGFAVQAHRWVVERTFAWLGRYRRLAKDYDLLPQTSETWVYLAMTHLMLKRLTKTTK